MVRGPFMSRAASLSQQSVKTALGLACGENDRYGNTTYYIPPYHESDMNVIYQDIGRRMEVWKLSQWRRILG